MNNPLSPLLIIAAFLQMPKNDFSDSSESNCWYENKKILTSYNSDLLAKEIIDVFRMVEGENIVFEYQKRIEFGSEVNTQIFLFEINDEHKSFKIRDKEILNANCLYYSLGGAGLDFPDSVDFHISEGYLFGKKKKNGLWKIKVDVFVGKKRVYFESEFKQCSPSSN